MEITKADAKEIVSEISKLLGTKLNIMDSNGYIIASSDEKRVGSFHKAAYEIINNNLPLYEIDENNALEGTLPGQNLPIYNEGRILGVVGITGESKETSKYVSIIQKMTEILVQGKIREAKYQKRQNRINNYLFDWIYNEDYNSRENLISKGLELGIDITIPRRIIIIAIDNCDNHLEKAIIKALKNLDKNILVFSSSDYIIAALKDQSDEKLKEKFLSLKDKIKENKIHLGCCSGYEKHSLIHRQYIQALKAFEISKKRKESSIVFYCDLGIELLLNNIDNEIKNEIINKVFKSLNEKEIKDYLKILTIYYEENGALKIIASKLNIHINTLQYHLNKFKNKTDYDPRDYRDSVVLQLALNFYKEIND